MPGVMEEEEEEESTNACISSTAGMVATSLISSHQDLKLYIHLNNVEVCCVITNLLKFDVCYCDLW